LAREKSQHQKCLFKGLFKAGSENAATGENRKIQNIKKQMMWGTHFSKPTHNLKSDQNEGDHKTTIKQ